MKKEARRRAEELVSKMTLEEKASQLRYDAPAIERLGIPAYNWWNEALHGVARAGTATAFPQAIGMAAMFDDALLNRIADAISTAARAKYNAVSKAVKIKVNPQKVKIVAKKKTFKAEKKVKKYTVTLKNSKGKAIKGKKLVLTINKKKYTAKTNKKGKATFKIKNLKKKGTYKAKVKFAGDKTYKKITKKAKIKIK